MQATAHFVLLVLLVAFEMSLGMMLAVHRHRYQNVQPSSVQLNSATLSFSYIDSNEVVEAEENRRASATRSSSQLLYADSDIIVFSKAHNLQSAPGFRSNDSLATDVREMFRIERTDHMIAHRLDYATSGVIVYARNLDALKALHNQFRQKHSVYKRYSAIISGIMDGNEGEINLPIGKDMARPPLCQIDTTLGKNSVTKWNLVACCARRNLSKVHLHPITGRTHQLRLHLSAIGRPILGDLFYAPTQVYRAAPRLLLHAEELRVRHPRTNEPMRFVSTCPFSIEEVM